MGKFRSLFKVRQPGNGDAFQKKANAPKKGPAIANKGMAVPNAGKKSSV